MSIRIGSRPHPVSHAWTQSQLISAQRRLSSAALKLKGVSGIGVGQRSVVVYLVRALETTRKAVRALADKKAPGVPLSFKVLGRVVAQGESSGVTFHDKHGRPVRGHNRRYKA
jgi:hypothetical protein